MRGPSFELSLNSFAVPPSVERIVSEYLLSVHLFSVLVDWLSEHVTPERPGNVPDSGI